MTVSDWYVVMKAGCWAAAAGDENVNFNLLFDEISLIDLGDVAPSGLEQFYSGNDDFRIFPNPSGC